MATQATNCLGHDGNGYPTHVRTPLVVFSFCLFVVFVRRASAWCKRRWSGFNRRLEEIQLCILPPVVVLARPTFVYRVNNWLGRVFFFRVVSFASPNVTESSPPLSLSSPFVVVAWFAASVAV